MGIGASSLPTTMGAGMASRYQSSPRHWTQSRACLGRVARSVDEGGLRAGGDLGQRPSISVHSSVSEPSAGSPGI
jgi:hypothetical protein